MIPTRACWQRLHGNQTIGAEAQRLRGSNRFRSAPEGSIPHTLLFMGLLLILPWAAPASADGPVLTFGSVSFLDEDTRSVYGPACWMLEVRSPSLFIPAVGRGMWLGAGVSTGRSQAEKPSFMESNGLSYTLLRASCGLTPVTLLGHRGKGHGVWLGVALFASLAWIAENWQATVVGADIRKQTRPTALWPGLGLALEARFLRMGRLGLGAVLSATGSLAKRYSEPRDSAHEEAMSGIWLRAGLRLEILRQETSSTSDETKT